MPWSYKDLQMLPIFMREDIYKTMDEFVEKEKAAIQNAKQQLQL